MEGLVRRLRVEHPLAKVGVRFGVRQTARALDVERGRARRFADEFEFGQVVCDELFLAPLEAVLAVGVLAEAAAVEEAARVARLLLALDALVLRAVEAGQAADLGPVLLL